MANRFFVGDTDDDWSDGGNWSATSGGAGGAGIPGGSDTAFFDANSPDCASAASQSIGAINCTGYTNTITLTGGVFIDIFSDILTTVLSSSTTYVDFALRAIVTTATNINIDFNNATIKELILINNTASNRTVTFSSSKINLTGKLEIRTLSTGAMTASFAINNPDISLNSLIGSTTSTGGRTLNMGSGTWFYTGNSFDLTTLTGFDANTSTLQFDMNDADFTWDDGAFTLHNVTVNFNQTTNRTFNSTPGTTITITGKFEVHVLNTANLSIDFESYICPNGFITEEASSGQLAISSFAPITLVRCRAGTGTGKEIDLRGLFAIDVTTLEIGDADYTFRPGDTDITTLITFSTLLTSTIRTITFVGDSLVIVSQWDVTFTDNTSCDPLSLVFSNCSYAPSGGAFQQVNNKNALTNFNLDMGTLNWKFPINSSGDGSGTFLNDIATLIGTTGTTTFTLTGTDVTNLDLRTELNDVVINGGTGTRTIQFESTRAPIINGSLTLEVTTAGTVTLDYNSNQIFEVKGNFIMQVNGGSGSVTLNMGINTWKFGGNITINTSAQIILIPETSDTELNGTAAQVITLDSTQMNTVTISNTSTAGVTFEDATKFTEINANAVSNNINLNFKESLVHVIDTLTITGTGSKRVRLRSKVSGTQWKLTTASGQIVDHVDVQDSDASTSSGKINAIDITSIDSGNNIFWNFFFINNVKTTIAYDYSGNIFKISSIIYDYSSFIINRNKKIVYDYSGIVLNRAKLILYDYLKFVPDNVRLVISPYAQDSVRLNWSGFVPPADYVGEFFYGVYVDGEPYETDIPSGQTWLDVNGLVNLEDVIIEVVIQGSFGEIFTFDLTDVGDRIKLLFKESSDPNVHRYVFFGDNATGTINFNKEIGEIIVQERLDKINTDFVPEGS